MMKDISVIIPSYNTKEITQKCIQYLTHVLGTKPNRCLSSEIIVVDNASSDGSREMLQKLPVTSVLLKENVGFSRANNIALQKASGKYILFLNSDVYVKDINFVDLIGYLQKNNKRGALTVRVNLENGSIDKASHRGFPTVWNSMCYYLGLEKIAVTFPFLQRVFGGYHLLYRDLKAIHEVDVISGAFFLTKQSVLDEVGYFDEAFFMYGEDIDLAYRIKKAGYKIIYYPLYTVLHLKYKSGLGTSEKHVRHKIKHHFYDAMKIFYKKHYEQKYPSFFNALIYALISYKMNRV